MAQTGLNCRSAAAAAAAVVAEKHGQGTVETAGSQIHHVLRIVVVEELLAQKMLVPVDSLDSHRRMPFGVFSFFCRLVRHFGFQMQVPRAWPSESFR